MSGSLVGFLLFVVRTGFGVEEKTTAFRKKVKMG